MFSSNLSRKLNRKVNTDKEKNDSSKLTLQVSIYCNLYFLPCSQSHAVIHAISYCPSKNIFLARTQ